jgi:pre-mRNA-splicing factor CWC22
MARFVAHLLYTDGISWEVFIASLGFNCISTCYQVLSEIKLNEDDTTSSGRIYIKIVFQELAEFLGLAKLYERIRDP